MILTSLGITFLLLLISTISLVGSAYYSDKKYKLGRFLWKFSIATGFLYSLSGMFSLGLIVYKLIDFLF